MLDFDRFDFNTKGDKVTIRDTRSGDEATVNRSQYAKNVKGAFWGTVGMAALYGGAIGFLMGAKERTKALPSRKRKNRRKSRGISKFLPF